MITLHPDRLLLLLATLGLELANLRCLIYAALSPSPSPRQFFSPSIAQWIYCGELAMWMPQEQSPAARCDITAMISAASAMSICTNVVKGEGNASTLLAPRHRKFALRLARRAVLRFKGRRSRKYSWIVIN